MRAYVILGVCVLAVIIVASTFWFTTKSPTSNAALTSPTAPKVAPLPQSKPLAIDTSNVVKPKHRVIVHIPFTLEEQVLMRWRAEQIAKDPASDWKTPINFYGLVIDENNQPLPGATVKWITTNVTGNGNGSTTSGSDGRFFIDTAGKGIDVIVQKDGYRTVERGAGFEFADFTQPSYYDHDKDNPAIFHLRKIPPFEPIYIRTGAVRDYLAGNKITVDPQTGRVIQGESSQGMWIQFVPGPQNTSDRGQYDILLGTASGGGTIIVTGDSDENAPTAGYQMSLDTKTFVDYDEQRFISIKAFFKDGTGHYGSMSFNIELGGNKLTLGYVLKYNPSGGRSLAASRGSAFQINK